MLKGLYDLCESSITDDALVEALSDYHEADIADVFPLLSETARKRLSHVLPPNVISDIFSYLDNAEEYIEKMDAERAADIIESMDADDAVDLLDELNEDTRSEIIELMDDEAVEDINLINSYDEDQVGSRMTTNFIIIKSDMTIKQAMKTMIDQAADNDNVSTIYVENENGEYCGAIVLRDLIVARQDASLSDIIMTSYPYLTATESIEECIERLKDYGEDSIPVLGANKKVLGVITSTDLVEAVDDQLGDDYAKLAGLTAEEDMEESLPRSIRKRIPWLLALFFLGLGVSTVVGSFKNVISSLPIIVSFQSLVLDMSGNGGTQSLAVTIRVLSDEKLKGKRILRLIFKELRVGLVNGFILGSLACVISGVFIMLTTASTAAYAFTMSGCIGLALLIAMTMSSMFGTMIPLFFKKIKIDPAVASGPLITTINDLVAVVTYYGLAWLLLIQLAL
ncbi:MAG: magnesium transporter [Clostridiales bacterium]|nr:magnesium transporter [Clostridiales bacterium]